MKRKVFSIILALVLCVGYAVSALAASPSLDGEFSNWESKNDIYYTCPYESLTHEEILHFIYLMVMEKGIPGDQGYELAFSNPAITIPDRYLDIMYEKIKEERDSYKAKGKDGGFASATYDILRYFFPYEMLIEGKSYVLTVSMRTNDLSVNPGDDIIINYLSISIYYYEDVADKRDDLLAAEEVARNIADAARAYSSDSIEQLRYVNNYLCDTVSYDYVAYNASKTMSELTDYNSYSAINPLLHGKAVCSGYSYAFEMICNDLAIPCFYYSNNLHAWNVVYVNSQWLMIDVTWNDDEYDEDAREDYFLIEPEKWDNYGNHYIKNDWLQICQERTLLNWGENGNVLKPYLDFSPKQAIIDKLKTLKEETIAVTASASDWAVEQINAAISANLVPASLQSKYTQATTRAEFCALAVALYETVKDAEITERATFSDTSDVNVQKMAALGVVNGVGDNKFSPDSALTREQAATMLSRLADAISKPLTAQAPTFNDNSSVSVWAFDAVGQMQATGIMGGVGDNTFSPSTDYTREQSIVTILRLYDIMK